MYRTVMRTFLPIKSTFVELSLEYQAREFGSTWDEYSYVPDRDANFSAKNSTFVELSLEYQARKFGSTWVGYSYVPDRDANFSANKFHLC